MKVTKEYQVPSWRRKKRYRLHTLRVLKRWAYNKKNSEAKTKAILNLKLEPESATGTERPKKEEEFLEPEGGTDMF